MTFFNIARQGCNADARPAIPVYGPSRFLDAGGRSLRLVQPAIRSESVEAEQHLCPQHVEAVAPPVSVGDLHQAVDGLGVGVGNASVEVVEDRLAPVAGRGQEFAECTAHGRSQARQVQDVDQAVALGRCANG